MSTRHWLGSILLVVTLALATVVAQQPEFNGQWLAEPSDAGHALHFTLRYERHSDGNHSNYMNSFELPLARVQGLTAATLASSGTQSQFQLARDAGTFNCQGWFANGKGSGHWTFVPNAQFASALAQRGIGTPTPEESLKLGLADASLAFADTLKQAGYNFNVQDLVRAANHGVSENYVREINQLGYHPQSLDKLVRMRDHGVDGEYIKGLAEYNIKNLSDDEVIRLRDHGVDPHFIGEMRKTGLANLSAEQLTKLRDHGVSPEFVAEIRAAGFSNVTADEFIRMRDHGVSPDFMRDLARYNIKGLGIEELIALRDHGVTPEFIGEMQKAGLSNLSRNELIRLRDHGVSPEFVAAVRKNGLTSLTVDDFVKMRDHGVSADYVRRYGKGRSVEEVIRMHDRGEDNMI